MCTDSVGTHTLHFIALQVRAKQEEWDRQAAEVARLHATTPDQLYHADLDAFEAALDERDEEDAKEAELLVSQRGRAGRAGGAKVCKLPPGAVKHHLPALRSDIACLRK